MDHDHAYSLPPSRQNEQRQNHPATRFRISTPHFELRPNAQPDPATLERSLNYADMEIDDQPPYMEPGGVEIDNQPEEPREFDDQPHILEQVFNHFAPN